MNPLVPTLLTMMVGLSSAYASDATTIKGQWAGGLKKTTSTSIDMVPEASAAILEAVQQSSAAMATVTRSEPRPVAVKEKGVAASVEVNPLVEPKSNDKQVVARNHQNPTNVSKSVADIPKVKVAKPTETKLVAKTLPSSVSVFEPVLIGGSIFNNELAVNTPISKPKAPVASPKAVEPAPVAVRPIIKQAPLAAVAPKPEAATLAAEVVTKPVAISKPKAPVAPPKAVEPAPVAVRPIIKQAPLAAVAPKPEVATLATEVTTKPVAISKPKAPVASPKAVEPAPVAMRPIIKQAAKLFPPEPVATPLSTLSPDAKLSATTISTQMSVKKPKPSLIAATSRLFAMADEVGVGASGVPERIRALYMATKSTPEQREVFNKSYAYKSSEYELLPPRIASLKLQPVFSITDNSDLVIFSNAEDAAVAKEYFDYHPKHAGILAYYVTRTLMQNEGKTGGITLEKAFIEEFTYDFANTPVRSSQNLKLAQEQYIYITKRLSENDEIKFWNWLNSARQGDVLKVPSWVVLADVIASQ